MMNGYSTNGYKTTTEADTIPPPHSLEAEEAVLGALMIDPDGFLRINLLGIKSTDFFISRHSLIFQAMESLNSRGIAIDTVTMVDELQRQENLHTVGGPAAISQLLGIVPSSTHLEYYTQIIKRYSVQRQIIGAAAEMTRYAHSTDETDPNVILARAGETLSRVKIGSQGDSLTDMRQASQLFLDRLEALQNATNGIIGIPTDIPQLDYYTQGLQRSHFIVLAAPPGSGKTSLAVQLAANSAKRHGKRALVFSLEMTTLSLMNRIISAEAQVDSAKIKSGTLNQIELGQVISASTRVSEWPLRIDDRTNSISGITATAILHHAKHGLDLVVVDYIQRIDAGLGPRAQSWECISHISNSLKSLAKTLNIPVLAVSSLLEKQIVLRGDKRPQRADLKGSGDLAYDADQIWFLYCDALYNENAVPNLTEIIVDKNREGRVGVAEVYFKKPLTRFESIEKRTIDLRQVE